MPDTEPSTLIHFTTPVLLKFGRTACQQDHRTHQVSASPGDVTCFSCRKSPPFLTRQGEGLPQRHAPAPLTPPVKLSGVMTQHPVMAEMYAEAIRRGEQVPSYLHDCSDCEYLGSTLRGTGYAGEVERVELYWCHGPEEGNALARFSSEPAHYVSGLNAAQHDPNLALAVVRAIHQGLVKANALHFL
jgi:hypothetical protein